MKKWFGKNKDPQSSPASSDEKNANQAQKKSKFMGFLRWIGRNFLVIAICILVIWLVLSLLDRFVVVNRLTRPLSTASLNLVPAGYENIPGTLFTYTVINLIETEKQRPFGGYRPDNIFWFGKLMPYDNVENFQIGVMEVVQRTVIYMKERISRAGGGSDEFNKFLVQSSESLNYKKTMPILTSWQIRDGVTALRGYATSLKTGNSAFVVRTDALYDLLWIYRELLGDTHRNLAKRAETNGTEVSMFQTDNHYYQAMGEAYAVSAIMRAIRIEFNALLKEKGCLLFMDELEESIGYATDFRPPWVILDGAINAQLWPNHRSNLETPINDARQKIISMMATINR